MAPNTVKPELVNGELDDIQFKISADRPLDVYDLNTLKRLAMECCKQTNTLFCFHPGCDWKRPTEFTGEGSEEVKSGMRTLYSHINTRHWFWKLAHLPEAYLSGHLQPPPKPKAKGAPRAKAPRKKRTLATARFAPYPGPPTAPTAPSRTSTVAETSSNVSGMFPEDAAAFASYEFLPMPPDEPTTSAPNPTPAEVAALAGYVPAANSDANTLNIAPLTTVSEKWLSCIICGHFEEIVGFLVQEPERVAMQAHLQTHDPVVRERAVIRMQEVLQEPAQEPAHAPSQLPGQEEGFNALEQWLRDN